jgi:hypothetical protein
MDGAPGGSQVLNHGVAPRAIAKAQAVDEEQTGNCHATNWHLPIAKSNIYSGSTVVVETPNIHSRT